MIDSEFGIHSAIQLEQWLSGISADRPRVFSEKEGKILRALYDEPGRTDLASLTGMPEGEARAEIDRLREKVSLFLGVERGASPTTSN